MSVLLLQEESLQVLPQELIVLVSHFLFRHDHDSNTHMLESHLGTQESMLVLSLNRSIRSLIIRHLILRGQGLLRSGLGYATISRTFQTDITQEYIPE